MKELKQQLIGQRERMKFYDKKMYEKENIIKTTLLIIIIFFLGFTIGYIAICDELQEKEQIIVNQSIELESLRETVWMYKHQN